MPDIDAFIDRWKAAGGTELANYQLFLTDLAVLLDLPRPEPSTGDPRSDAYVFERPVKFAHGDGTESSGRIDLYRRGSFVLEAKKLRQTATNDTGRVRCGRRRRGSRSRLSASTTWGCPATGPGLLMKDTINDSEIETLRRYASVAPIDRCAW